MRHVFAQRIFIVIVRMCTIHTYTEFFFLSYVLSFQHGKRMNKFLRKAKLEIDTLKYIIIEYGTLRLNSLLLLNENIVFIQVFFSII